jgi:hypothetical protein
MRIRILEAEAVDASRLTDEDARLAGIDSAEALRALFLRWYGTKSPPRLFRNRFILETEKENQNEGKPTCSCQS